ncbi:MAG: hypothetical protein ACR2KF_06175 [Nitrososphaeraceae archaeon]
MVGNNHDGLRIHVRCPENSKIESAIIKTMWFSTLPWGCIPELSPNCMDMTNSASTHLGIVGGG